MDEVVAVFRKGSRIYSTGPFDPLVLDAVTGLSEMARNAYGDEFVHLETEGWIVSLLSGAGGVSVVSIGRSVDTGRLQHAYESYRVCVAYGDFTLMDSLVRMHRRRA